MATANNVDIMWAELTLNGIANVGELELITHINGYSEETNERCTLCKNRRKTV